MQSTDINYNIWKAGYEQCNADRIKSEMSEREFKVLELIKEGSSGIKIAKELKLTKRQVQNIFDKLRHKTKSKNVVALIVYCIRYKIIEL